MHIPRVWKLTFWITFTLTSACLAVVLTYALTLEDAAGNPRWAAERLLQRAEPMWEEMGAAFRRGVPPADMAIPQGDPLPTLRQMASFPLVSVAYHCTPDRRLTVVGAGEAAEPFHVDLKTWRPESYFVGFRPSDSSWPRDRAAYRRKVQENRVRDLIDHTPYWFSYQEFYPTATDARLGRPILMMRGDREQGWLAYRLASSSFRSDIGERVLDRHGLAGSMSWSVGTRGDKDYLPPHQAGMPYPVVDTLSLSLDSIAVLQENIAVQQDALYAYAVLAGGLILGSLGTSRQIRAILGERAVALAQSNFVSGVSHEMRTPLTTIKMYAEMVEQGLVEGGQKQAQYMRTIGQECDRLTRLIENVLDYARISGRRREYRFERVDARVLVEEAIASMEGPLAQSGMAVEWVAPEALPVEADRDAIVQALVNLIGNAIKYAPGEKCILITAKGEAEETRIAVRDFGTGVPRAEQRKIFQPFYRAGSEMTRQATGSGLGLALVQEYARAHRGRVELVSKPGEGATFTLVLPRGRKS